MRCRSSVSMIAADARRCRRADRLRLGRSGYLVGEQEVSDWLSPLEFPNWGFDLSGEVRAKPRREEEGGNQGL